MSKVNEVTISKKDIYNDPYNFEYKEICSVLGESEAKNLFNDLYKKTFQKKYQTLHVKQVYKSSDTLKYVYELSDHRYIETVCIKRKDGVTACVSTQVGCPVQCAFCESGRNRIYKKSYSF